MSEQSNKEIEDKIDSETFWSSQHAVDNLPGLNSFTFLDKIFQQIRNTVMITDVERNIVWVNKRFKELFGYRLSEIRGLNPHEFLIETMNCEATETDSCVELKCKAKDGSKYWLQVEIDPIKNDITGDIIGFTAIGTDITEKKLQAEGVRMPVTSIINLMNLINNCGEGEDEKKKNYINLLNTYIQDINRITRDVTAKNDPVNKKLTKRELEVLEGLKEGLSYNEIGEKLFISPKTVNQHLKSIYKKMEVENRSKLLAKIFSEKTHWLRSESDN